MDVSAVTKEAITKLEHDAILADPFWDQFAVLGKDVIEEVLIAKNWNQEEAVEELILRATGGDTEQEKAKLEARRRQALLEMQEVFGNNIPKEKIEETIAKYDGDMDAVTNELILLNVDCTIQLLANKFGATFEHTKELYLANDKNDRKVTAILIKEQALVKVRAHQHEFPMFSEEDLLRAYFSKNSNEHLWLAYLNTEKQRLLAEEEERTRQRKEEAEREAAKKAEEVARQQRVAEENARIERENREKLEKLAADQREEQQRKIAEEARKRKEEEERIAKEKAEAEQRAKEQEEAEKAKLAEQKRLEEEAKKKQAEIMFNQSVAIGHEELQLKKQQVAQTFEKMVRDGHGAQPPKQFGDTMPVPPKAEAPKNTPPAATKVWPVKIVVDKERVDSSGTVMITWTHSAEPTKADWIGLYKIDASNKSYLSWEKIEGNAEKRSGSISFTVPNNFGLCEFRYICPSARDQYQVFGVSNQFRIGPSFIMTKEVVSDTEIKVAIKKDAGEAHPYAWVALFSATSPNYLKPWHYVSQDQATINFTVPKKSGLYYVKLFASSAPDTLAAVIEHRVAGTDVLNFRPTDNSILISYDLSSVDTSTDNVWVGLFPQEEESNDNWKQFVWIKSNKGEITMKRPSNPQGTYELRLFGFGTKIAITKSNPAKF